MIKIFEKTWLVFLIAMFFGLIYPSYSFILEPYLIYFLIIMMTLSTKDIVMLEIFNKKDIKKSFVLLLANYLLLSSVIVMLAKLFIKNQNYFAGFIVMASIPCAISVIPFTKLLNGDTKLSTYGLIMTYLFSLFLTPAIIWLFFKQMIDIYELVKTILLLVILPLILSRFVGKFNHKLEKYDKQLINFLFLFTIYGFIGINRDTIIYNFFSLNSVILVLFLRTFVWTTLVYLLLKNFKIDLKYRRSIVIFSGYKNLGYTAILAFALFGREAALPATLGIFFELLTFVCLERLMYLIS